jgi:hypothetical protein
MREEEKLTYESIANRLTKEGIKSARNCKLMAEHVFSIGGFKFEAQRA